MVLQKERAQIDEQMMQLIAARVTAALREDLETLLAELDQPVAPAPPMTVEQIARHLGVSRSTVYAHWREWGGYKLGHSDKAPIRFDSPALPPSRSKGALRPPLIVEPSSKPSRRSRRRDLLVDAPRMTQMADGIE